MSKAKLVIHPLTQTLRKDRHKRLYADARPHVEGQNGAMSDSGGIVPRCQCDMSTSELSGAEFL